MALSKLNNGGWVHIFPEGSRSRDGGKTIAPAKRGVGRLEVYFLVLSAMNATSVSASFCIKKPAFCTCISVHLNFVVFVHC